MRVFLYLVQAIGVLCMAEEAGKNFQPVSIPDHCRPWQKILGMHRVWVYKTGEFCYHIFQ